MPNQNGLNLFRKLTLAACLMCYATLAAAVQTGGWRLDKESSPYLQLHADNPVEWYPWGEEALAKARRENKPLFISIGYFTCHWCHVMARESFSDPSIAKLLNEHFVAIKIDREQRPDLDAAYMLYVEITLGRGGWPMSVWATPDGKPFLGGTYYPPESVAGRPGFRELLQRLAAVWAKDEPGVRATAQNAVERLESLGRSARPAKLTNVPIEQARQEYREVYDELQGGFGTAPKFPQPARLLFLLEDTETSSQDMAVHTLERMAAGGIHDRLGGGFHRYSTDFEWRLPHFEKMLYDQALIARAYLVAWRNTRREDFAGTVRDILDFSLRELRHPQGGFFSALGADSPAAHAADGHMEEGAYYTWDWSQLAAALGKGELLDWVIARYGLSKHGNALHDVTGEMDGRNVLVAVLDDSQLAQKFGVGLDVVKQRNEKADDLLRAARDTRPPVPVDDKVVTVWNGYMITTLALAGRLLDEPRYIEAAEQAATFIMKNLYDEKKDTLYRDWRDNTRGVAGFSEDYAGMSEGLLHLYRISGEKRWLKLAQRLVDRQIGLFWDDTHGGFYNTASHSEAWLREKQVMDGASLSDNSVSIHVLLALARLTGNKDYQRRAEQTAAWAMAQLANVPEAMPYALLAWPRLLANAGAQKDAVTD